MIIDYHATVPDWAVVVFLLGWAVLVVAVAISLLVGLRDRR